MEAGCGRFEEAAASHRLHAGMAAEPGAESRGVRNGGSRARSVRAHALASAWRRSHEISDFHQDTRGVESSTGGTERATAGAGVWRAIFALRSIITDDADYLFEKFEIGSGAGGALEACGVVVAMGAAGFFRGICDGKSHRRISQQLPNRPASEIERRHTRD